ncbi:MAG: pantoate--beta-alanine ligase [Myxococcota bacterium]
MTASRSAHARRATGARAAARGTKSSTTEPPKPATRVIESTGLMQATSMAARLRGQTIGFVPTMGALHEGHMALVREARLRADVVVVSIFVNPLQFGQAADLEKYPRTLERDTELCRIAGVDYVFAPDAASMYPEGFDTTVTTGKLSLSLEGASRPGHFDGVATVCTKLFALVQPHFAVFGEKDYQQLQVIRRVVRDLSLPLEIVPMPVLRDVDGLALSSRNVRLTPAQRKEATCLYRGLMAAQDAVQLGERKVKAIVRAAEEVLAAAEGFTTDYVAVVDPRTLEAMDMLGSGARCLLAGSFGHGPEQVRLIDNGPLFPMTLTSF